MMGRAVNGAAKADAAELRELFRRYRERRNR